MYPNKPIFGLLTGFPVLCAAALYVCSMGHLSSQVPTYGNLTRQEYGDAVYRQIAHELLNFFGADYNHTAIYSGLNSSHFPRVLEAIGEGSSSGGDTTGEISFSDINNRVGLSYYGAYTLANGTISFSQRRSVVSTAVALADAYIPYVIFDAINFSTGGRSIAYISKIRCDAVVEYAYEANGLVVWWPSGYFSRWSILSYPGDHNDAPTPPSDPSYEFSPWAQRGAPGVGSGNTYMTRPSVITLPTYEVTQVPSPGYVDVTVRATDVSGIHYIGYKKPGETTWSHSPTQPQHPTSDSFSYPVRVTSSGTFHYFAMDNGGNLPAVASNLTITVPPGPISVTVQSDPPGRSFTVDGITYSTAQTFNWTAGSSHSIGATTNQNGSPGVRYLWSNWSDGGAVTHTVAPTVNTTYTANFTTQYLLSMTAGVGGTVLPASSWQNSGAVVPIQATASPGYTFGSWTGTGSDSYSGENSSASVTMNGPVTQSAAFTKIVSVTVRANPPGPSFSVDGTNYTSAQIFNWLAGSSHAVETTSLQSGAEGVQFFWSGWSDGGALAHTVSPSNSATITANFATQYLLTAEAGPGGQVSPASGWQNSGAVVPLLAEASDGYNFALWNGRGAGSYSGAKVSPTVTMNGPITNTASFTQAVCSATLLKPTNGVAVLLPPMFVWAFRDNCHHKVYLATNPAAGIVVSLTNVFAAGTNTLALTETQWSNVVAELGEAAGYFWTVGSADAGQPGAALFAPWQQFFLPDGSFQILEPLTNAIFAKGTFLTLNLAASSSNALSYKWKFKKRLIAGATNSSLSISNAQSRNAGLYSVLVTDGSITNESGPVTVKVIDPARIRSGPLDRAVRLGKSTALTVSAAGTRPLAYQWFFNGDPIDGATTRRLVISRATADRQGIYSVRVSNAGGSVQSRSALLTVN